MEPVRPAVVSPFSLHACPVGAEEAQAADSQAGTGWLSRDALGDGIRIRFPTWGPHCLSLLESPWARSSRGARVACCCFWALISVTHAHLHTHHQPRQRPLEKNMNKLT